MPTRLSLLQRARRPGIAPIPLDARQARQLFVLQTKRRQPIPPQTPFLVVLAKKRFLLAMPCFDICDPTQRVEVPQH